MDWEKKNYICLTFKNCFDIIDGIANGNNKTCVETWTIIFIVSIDAAHNQFAYKKQLISAD